MVPMQSTGRFALGLRVGIRFWQATSRVSWVSLVLLLAFGICFIHRNIVRPGKHVGWRQDLKVEYK